MAATTLDYTIENIIYIQNCDILRTEKFHQEDITMLILIVGFALSIENKPKLCTYNSLGIDVVKTKN